MARWTYTDKTIDACKRLGVTNDQVASIVLDPEFMYDNSPTCRVMVRDGWCAIVEPRERLVMAVYPERRLPGRFKRRSSTPKMKGSSGGTVVFSFDDLVSMAIKQGWEKRQGSKHVVLYPADENYPPVSVPGSASDWRTIRNFQAQLKRYGLELTP